MYAQLDGHPWGAKGVRLPGPLITLPSESAMGRDDCLLTKQHLDLSYSPSSCHPFLSLHAAIRSKPWPASHLHPDNAGRAFFPSLLLPSRYPGLHSSST